MADLGGTFDATTVDPSGVFDPVPAGDYPAVMVDSEWRHTRTGGRYLNLTWRLDGGEHDGRLVWQMLNLDNPNPKAVEIAQKELSAISHATGKMAVSNSEEFYHIPVSLRVGVKTDDYGTKNVVKGVRALGAAPVAVPAGPRPVAAVARPAAASAAAPRGNVPSFMKRAG